jgi:hypothetical protein
MRTRAEFCRAVAIAVRLYGCASWTPLEVTEKPVVRTVAGYRITDHKSNEYIGEVGITDINT